jgi:chorismate mutase
MIATKDLASLWRKRPLLIAGPCSAETEEQVLTTAEALKKIGNIDVFRAGIWKPRTRPGSFEGVGSVGLSWLQKVKERTGLYTAVEVANAKQVNEALNAGVDILWIGARTTVNPFSVQEIADALVEHPQIPIYIKNPLNADVDLWTGAVERIQKAGTEHIGLIHRGFSMYGHSEFRNAPLWHLALEMKRRFATLPFLIDPSHIAGKRILLQGIMQHAIDLDYDGIIIESHDNPDAAWSDAAQQVTPATLNNMLQQIVWRNDQVISEAIHESLDKIRVAVDQIDDQILELISKRMRYSDQIGLYKKDNNITILQMKRWNNILERVLNKSEEWHLSKAFLLQYLDAIHIESIKHQDAVMNDKTI